MRGAFLAVAVVLLAGAGPLSAQTPSVQAPIRPGWIDALPEAPGRLYALGTADLGGNEGQAITRASDRARLEVVTRLRATVKGGTSVATRTAESQRDGVRGAASGDRQIRDEVSVAAQAQDLPGLVVDRTHLDPAGRTAYALAYLDLVQAERTLAGRMALIQEGRSRVAGEATRKARWKLRKLKTDLERLEEALALLALTGTGEVLRPELRAERQALDARLSVLDRLDLPPVDLAKLSVALRSNIDLPAGVEAYLLSQIAACGPQTREINPDLILNLTFAGAAKGPELIYVDMDIFSGVTYRIQANLELQDAGGAVVAKPATIQVAQGQSPEGMINQFRRLFERRLPRLFTEYQSEMK
jgi:hypothetical protein